jgi:hypothetical protein
MKCIKCNKIYKRKYNYDKHILNCKTKNEIKNDIPNNEKNTQYNCNGCKSKFKNEKELNIHTTKCKFVAREIACMFCGKLCADIGNHFKDCPQILKKQEPKVCNNIIDEEEEDYFSDDDYDEEIYKKPFDINVLTDMLSKLQKQYAQLKKQTSKHGLKFGEDSDEEPAELFACPQPQTYNMKYENVMYTVDDNVRCIIERIYEDNKPPHTFCYDDKNNFQRQSWRNVKFVLPNEKECDLKKRFIQKMVGNKKEKISVYDLFTKLFEQMPAMKDEFNIFLEKIHIFNATKPKLYKN